MNQLRRQMVELCRDVASLDDPKTAGIARRASQLLPRIEPKPSKAVKANRVRRETKRAGEKWEMGELRRQVFERAHLICELCGKPFVAGVLCHLNGGIGRRRPRQSPSNCMAGHDFCHRDLDCEPLKWLPKIQAWAARHGYPLPERFRVLAALRGVEVPPTNRKPDHGPESAF